MARLTSWLQLLRAPNLLTVPGDPLAGFLLARHGHLDGRVAVAVGASWLFYAFGLVANDLADFQEDTAERPERPLPSRAISRGQAAFAAGALAVSALSLCSIGGSAALVFGTALLFAISAYDFGLKKLAILGPLAMGVCRGGSLLLGFAFAAPHASAAEALPKLPHSPALWAAGILALYIAAVTNLARSETKSATPLAAALPFFALMLGVLGVLAIPARNHPSLPSLLSCLLAAWLVFTASKVHRLLIQTPPSPLPSVIGKWIRLLLPMQALFCLASRTPQAVACAAVLLALWPLAHLLSRRFYAS